MMCQDALEQWFLTSMCPSRGAYALTRPTTWKVWSWNLPI